MHHFRDTVVLSAANSWWGVRLADRQLAEELSKLVPVLYVEPTTSMVARFRRHGWRGVIRKDRLCLLGPSLARLSPEGFPGVAYSGVRRINTWLVAWQVRRALRTLRGTVRATIEANVLTPIMGNVGDRLSIFWAQDDFAAMAPEVGMDPRPFAKAEKQLARDADVIVAANSIVLDAISRGGSEGHLIPFGCDFELFASTAMAEPAPEISLPSPTAVFMGHLGDRIEFEILESLAASGASLLLVGPLHPRVDPARFEAILARGNVQWVGERPFEELPRYLAACRVGIVPYTDSRFNRASFPLKVLEYLAAGLPVVATDLPAVRWLNSSQIWVESDPLQFVNRVLSILNVARDAEDDNRCREFAAGHSWAVRASAFAAVIDIHDDSGNTDGTRNRTTSRSG